MENKRHMPTSVALSSLRRRCTAGSKEADAREALIPVLIGATAVLVCFALGLGSFVLCR